MAEQSGWFVYILTCADKTLYTGITTDVTRRVSEHNSATSGAKYTKMRRPVKLSYTESYISRSDAAIREAALKKLSRKEKELLIKRV